MSILVEKLANWGCDTKGALERLIDDEELYESCLRMLVEDSAFEKLKEALVTGNMEKAFDSAHTLKGVIANMGITPMYHIVVQIVEPLRSKKMEGLMPLYEELMRQNEYLKELLG